MVRSITIAVTLCVLASVCYADPCLEQTVNQPLGPFYQEDAPVQHDLTTYCNASIATSNALVNVSGFVYSSCGEPLANAYVDLWHADGFGYYHDDECLRGLVHSNDDGFYHFLTIVPDPYGTRPPHIHAIVTHPDDIERIRTQIYFAPHPYLDKGDHPVDLWITPANTSDGLVASFDFVLRVDGEDSGNEEGKDDNGKGKDDCCDTNNTPKPYVALAIFSVVLLAIVGALVYYMTSNGPYDPAAESPPKDAEADQD